MVLGSIGRGGLWSRALGLRVFMMLWLLGLFSGFLFGCWACRERSGNFGVLGFKAMAASSCPNLAVSWVVEQGFGFRAFTSYSACVWSVSSPAKPDTFKYQKPRWPDQKQVVSYRYKAYIKLPDAALMKPLNYRIPHIRPLIETLT